MIVKVKKKMSLKKELLHELSEKQLENFAKSQGIQFTLSTIQKKYYENWNDCEKLVDMINDEQEISIKDIEDYIKIHRRS